MTVYVLVSESGVPYGVFRILRDAQDIGGPWSYIPALKKWESMKSRLAIYEETIR